ncbi:hypothetical protein PVMG_05086 [Plasmodium vivax Mauritania I]|uniref:Variable surface protein Vir35 n=1 Tax=Plasmodium vivax Mauritania I TaxID=1035515 RepID=A0A0J9W479_PLAVI|nr:hypothetical protein PVMG_05086 [Plasmodium vivax Mauritania I]
MRHFRLLAIKNGIPKELDDVSFSNAFSYDKYKKLKMKKEDSSTYKRLKREGLNELDIYKKSFACKYSKKKGLVKLECDCEKKIFDKLDGIYLLYNNMKDDIKGFKKQIRKRYGLSVGISVIYILIAGIIIAYEYFRVDKHGEIPKSLVVGIQIIGTILFYVLPVIISLVLFYIAIKIIKYDRLVLGKVEGKKIAKKISCYYDDEFNST